ncbi:MAG: hypothetical protein A2001_01400 [Treponema sp. GWC1_61_84]|nr:MAG: hypothetical protein A2001_01400 [Treponema sp. GWC1_61_84]
MGLNGKISTPPGFVAKYSHIRGLVGNKGDKLILKMSDYYDQIKRLDGSPPIEPGNVISIPWEKWKHLYPELYALARTDERYAGTGDVLEEAPAEVPPDEPHEP